MNGMNGLSGAYTIYFIPFVQTCGQKNVGDKEVEIISNDNIIFPPQIDF